jgi:spermidine/putrescine transport system permease protein
MTLPFWTSYLLRVFSWKVILGYEGVINSSLIGMGMIEKPLEFLLYSQTAVVITLAHAWAAFAILPLSMPGVIAATFLIFIPTTGDYITPALLGGPDGAMIGNLIQLQFGAVNNWPMGAALSIVLTLWIAAIALVFVFITRRADRMAA